MSARRTRLLHSHLLKPVWFVLAIAFIVEAWLWDRLQPVVARLVAAIPLKAIKAWLTEQIESLSPVLTLMVFIVPVVVLFPFKVAGVWLLMRGHWLGAAGVIVMAKLVGVGVAAFIFDTTRPKLLQMVWFKRLYDLVILVRDWAHALVEPAKQRILAMIRSEGGPVRRFFAVMQRFRRRVQDAQ